MGRAFATKGSRDFLFTNIHSNSLVFTVIHPIWKKIYGGGCYQRGDSKTKFQSIPNVSNAFQSIPTLF